MSSFKNDYAFGKKNEIKILSKLRSYFKDDSIVPSPSEFSTYDFESKVNKRKIEQKSRNNFYNTFPTTIIPLKKLKEDVTLVFSFRDGDYCIDYDKEVFNQFEHKLFVRSQRTDYNDKLDDYVYIPIEKLTKMD